VEVQVQVNPEAQGLTVPTRVIRTLPTTWRTNELILSVLCHPTGRRLTRRRARCTSSTTRVARRIGLTRGFPACRRRGLRTAATTSCRSGGSASTTRTTAPTSSTTSTAGRSTKIRFWLPRLKTRVQVRLYLKPLIYSRGQFHQYFTRSFCELRY